MTDLVLAGVSVNFPKEPYQCQIKYMEQNIIALNNATNALLESPTGTGKTLCLLCSTLAWQKHNMKNATSKDLAYSSMPSVVGSVPPNNTKPVVSLIIYASRTHSQLSQVVSELRSTRYRPRMTVLGSRDQLCIHEKISKLKGGALNHACNTLSSKRGCMYKNNLDSFGGAVGGDMDSTSSAAASRPVLDIEELVAMGRSERICPYFYSRDSSTNSEMVLLPYNYLLDASIRKSLKVAWQDSIVIFDEGHNLEKVASDAASCSFSSTDLAAVILELQRVLTLLKEEADLKRMDAADSSAATDEGEGGKKKKASGQGGKDGQAADGTVQKPKLASVAEVLAAVFNLEQALSTLPLRPNEVGGANPSAVLPGVFLRDMLTRAGLNSQKGHVDEMRRSANMLMEAAEEVMNSFDGAGGGAAALSVVVPTLMDFAGAVERVFRGERSGHYGDYKVFVCEEDNKPPAQFGGRSSGGRLSGGGEQFTSPRRGHAQAGAVPSKKRVVNYWCFSPGVAMEELKALGVRSVILTSGTLSPMAALREDMKLPFPVQLENPHVIKNSQIWVGALSCGPRGKQLNSSYSNRESGDYKDELGMAILQICLAMAGRSNTAGMQLLSGSVIPSGDELRGGVLVFFPSYGAMDGFVRHWTASGAYDRIRNVVGAIIVEPRGGSIGPTKGSAAAAGKSQSKPQAPQQQQLGMMTSNSYKKADKKLDGDSDQPEADATVQGVLAEFEAAMKRHGGCVLMAVCRGKVSEGIDFSDAKGRVVIVTGIPFAPYMDPWVVLKKQYLDEKCCAPASVPAHQSGLTVPYAGNAPSGPLNGNMWLDAAPGPSSGASSGYYGHMPPAPPVKTEPARYPNSAAPLVKAAGHTLTGQNWYNQSASRAVNQCLGRVIRHKKDWGAVFLLDDRFLNDGQNSQLSGWMRPRLTKFKSFGPALGGFRAFLSSAMHDKSLSLEPATTDRSNGLVRVHTNPQHSLHAHRTHGGPAAMAAANQGAETFARSVLVDQRVLEGEAGEADSNFIDPQLLLTQPSDAGEGIIRGGFGHPSTASGSRKVSGPPPPTSRGATATSANLISTIGRLKRSEPGTSLWDTAAPIKKAFGLAATKTADSFAFSQTSLSQSQPQSQSQQTQASSIVRPSAFSQLRPPSTLSQSGREGGGGDGDLKAVVGMLKKLLPAEAMERLRVLLVAAKQSGLRVTPQVKQFVSDVHAIVAPVSADRRRDSMLGLSGLVPPGPLRETYRTFVRQCVSDDLIGGGVHQGNTAPPDAAPRKAKVVTSEGNGRLESEDVLARSSKRARAMLSMSQQQGQLGQPSDSGTGSSSRSGASSSRRPDFLSELKMLPGLELSAKPAAPAKPALRAGTTGGLVHSKLICGVCKSPPTKPCAARCGHIICEACWITWLRTSKTCPFCRKEASHETITRIVVK